MKYAVAAILVLVLFWLVVLPSLPFILVGAVCVTAGYLAGKSRKRIGTSSYKHLP